MERWNAKLELKRNMARDREVTLVLRKTGWKVLRVGECDLAVKHWPRVARRLRRALVLRGGNQASGGPV